MANKNIVWEQDNNGLEKNNKRKMVGQTFLTALFISAVSVLLIFAATKMFTDVFLLQTSESNTRFICHIVIAILALNFFNEWVQPFGKKKIVIVGNVVFLLLLSLVLYRSYGKPGSDLLEGLKSLVRLYVDRWNMHHGMGLQVEFGNINSQRLAAEFLMIVAAVVIQFISVLSRKRSTMLLLPAVVLGFELLVGATPEWRSLALVFVGGVLAFYLDGNIEISYKRLFVLAVGAVLIVFLCGSFLGQAANSVYDLNEEWLNFQRNMEEGIKNINVKKWLPNTDVVGNQAPDHTNEEVMYLTVSEIPQENIYLRGYHCNDYVDGMWEKDNKAFRQACKELGISEEEAAAKLLELRYDATAGTLNNRIQYDLNYTGIRSKYCYFPYAVDLREDTAGYRLSRDYVIEKNKGKKDNQVWGWQQTSYGVMSAGNLFLTEEESVIFEWYNDFVRENYLEVPTEQKEVKNLVSRMKTDPQCRGYAATLDTYRNTKEEINKARLQLADMVAETLWREADYSLELEELPWGEDAVEYFLKTSKEGFCVHFASAGVLMLREFGVPARYASGYMVRQGRFQGLEGAYSASVLDSDAHAWVEIYLENYGWIPVEVTPGYNQMSPQIPNSGVDAPENLEERMEEESSEEFSDGEQATEEQNTQEEQDVQGEQNVQPEQDVHSEQETKPEQGGLPDNGITDSGDQSTSNVMTTEAERTKYSGIIVAIIVIGLLTYVGYRYVHKREERKERLLTGYIHRGYSQKAVSWMNREMYRLLMRKKHSRKRFSDSEYLAALKETFPEISGEKWDVYFELVRRTTYSNESILMEEVKECYALYQAVIKKK